MSDTPPGKLLIVDDEAVLMAALRDTLRDEGYDTVGVTTGEEALAAMRNREFDIMLTDLMMPQIDGIALLRAALEIDPDLVGIIMTGQGTIATAIEAMKTGALDYVLKPFKLSAILPVLTRAMGVRRLRLENIHLREAVAIHQLSMAIAFTFDFRTVLQMAADAAYQQSDGGEVSIMLPTSDGKELYVAEARGQNAEALRGRRVPVDGPLADWIARSRELLEKSEEMDGVRISLNHPLRSLCAGISMPMLSGGQFIGVLNFTSAHPHRRVHIGQAKALHVLGNAAASALKAATLHGQLAAAEKRYRRLAENAQDVIYRFELVPQRRFAYVNPAVTVVTGYAPEAYYSHPNLVFRLVHPEDRRLLENILRGEFNRERPLTLRWVRRDGTVIWIEQRNVPVRDESGRLIALEGIARDISERKRAEQAIRQLNEDLEQRVLDRTAELEAANKELEAFSYSVSHDLRAPLRAIDGFTRLFQESCGEQITPENQQLLERVVISAQRMSQLIDDLLRFSRYSRQPLSKQTVPTGQLVRDTLQELRSREGGRNLDLRIGELPDCQADPALLKQVFVNLLSNALKFTRQREIAVIEVGSEERAGERVYFVRDNGAGFDMKYADKLFGVFQRLHSEDEFEGTGIGLANVQRIIQRHGGRIWAEAELDKGATFYFTLGGGTVDNPKGPAARTASSAPEPASDKVI
jgi:PAS domain S-box-containing protein